MREQVDLRVARCASWPASGYGRPPSVATAALRPRGGRVRLSDGPQLVHRARGAARAVDERGRKLSTGPARSKTILRGGLSIDARRAVPSLSTVDRRKTSLHPSDLRNIRAASATADNPQPHDPPRVPPFDARPVPFCPLHPSPGRRGGRGPLPTGTISHGPSRAFRYGVSLVDRRLAWRGGWG